MTIGKPEWLSKIGKAEIAQTKKTIKPLSDSISQRFPKATAISKKATITAGFTE